jgi:hypothetical protein
MIDQDLPLSRSRMADRKRNLGRQLLNEVSTLVVRERVEQQQTIVRLLSDFVEAVEAVRKYDREHPREPLIDWSNATNRGILR